MPDAGRTAGGRDAERRNADLTQTANRGAGRHGWLRLTPAYSRRLVAEILDRLAPGGVVLDPFSGTGTTVLTAAERGRDAVGVDVNPFLVWLGSAKVHRYRASTLARAAEAMARVEAADGVLAPVPPIRNVERWWHPRTLETLRRWRHAIDEERSRPVRDLLLIAFCRAAIASSNAAFDHQSLSFGPGDKAPLDALVSAHLRDAHAAVLAGAADAPRGRGRVLLGDARRLDALGDARIDAVVTSPPYANRISYVRELRPYMVWTGHLTAPRDAGELDWRAIGGTWGVATSRLGRWEADPAVPLPNVVHRTVRAIAKTDGKNAPLLARYVHRYAEDMARHLTALKPRLNPGAVLSYIVGNSKFYDVVVPTEVLLAELFDAREYRSVEVVRVRKRNSKKELYEFEVRAVA